MRIGYFKVTLTFGFVTVNAEMLHSFQPIRFEKVSIIPALLLAFAISLPLMAQIGLQKKHSTSTNGSRRPVVESPGTQDPGTQIPGWILKFDEEFDGKTLNYSTWSPHLPGTLTMDGSQMWTPASVAVSNGQAHISARSVKTGYTSGIMTTFGAFAQTYGRFEIRFRIPAVRGLEPCFRLLPIPSGDIPSVDVLDVIGSEPDKALFANSWGDARAERAYTGSYKLADLSAGFHILTLEWDQDQLVWTVDGVERFNSFDGVPHQPMYLAVSLAVGGEKAGSPDKQLPSPAVFDIDYIRVFARH